MVMTKKYFLWVEMVSTNGYRAHIKPTIDNNWNATYVSAEETPYGKVDMDRRRLGIFTYDQALMTATTTEGDTLLDRLKAECAHFGVKIITEQRAVDLCNEWYPSGEDPDYFELDVDGFTIIDNRPLVV